MKGLLVLLFSLAIAGCAADYGSYSSFEEMIFEACATTDDEKACARYDRYVARKALEAAERQEVARCREQGMTRTCIVYVGKKNCFCSPRGRLPGMRF